MRRNQPNSGSREGLKPKRKHSVHVHVRDREDGRVDIKYKFRPAIDRSTQETPALKVGRKAIKAVEDAIE